MYHKRSPQLLTLTLTLCFAFAWSAAAQIEDDMEDVSHFHHSFGDAVVQPAEGGVLIHRSKIDVDAGVDWCMEEGKPIPLDEAHDRLTLTPAEAKNGGYFVASILFMDEAGEFIAEQIWLSDTNKTKPRTLASVKALAEQNDIENAAGYKLRLRINPVETKGAGFVFKRITATAPEPE